MHRREFLVLLGGTLVGQNAAGAEQKPGVSGVPTVGVLWHAGSAEEEREFLSVLVAAFAELGYIEGRTINFIHRFPAEQPERFRALAKELVDRKVDLLVAVTAQGASAIKETSTSIPVVFVLVSDPVRIGLADSLSSPGKNFTGLSLMQQDLSGKKIALLLEAIPRASRIALMLDPRSLINKGLVKAYTNSAETAGLSLKTIEVFTPEDIEGAFSTAREMRADAVVTVTSGMFYNERVRFGAASSREKIPTFVEIAEMVPYGPLLSYGPDFPEFFRRSTGFVDKILKGARPADLPIEQPTRLKLVVNLKTAQTLGLTLPGSLLAAADEVLE